MLIMQKKTFSIIFSLTLYLGFIAWISVKNQCISNYARWLLISAIRNFLLNFKTTKYYLPNAIIESDFEILLMRIKCILNTSFFSKILFPLPSLHSLSESEIVYHEFWNFLNPHESLRCQRWCSAFNSYNMELKEEGSFFYNPEWN